MSTVVFACESCSQFFLSEDDVRSHNCGSEDHASTTEQVIILPPGIGEDESEEVSVGQGLVTTSEQFIILPSGADTVAAVESPSTVVYHEHPTEQLIIHAPDVTVETKDAGLPIIDHVHPSEQLIILPPDVTVETKAIASTSMASVEPVNVKPETGLQPMSSNVKSETQDRGIGVHEKANLSKTGKSFKCSKCNIKFKTWLELKTHMKSITHQNSSKAFPCPFCTKRTGFSEAKHLRKHIKQRHTQMICIFCEQLFKGERALHEHVISNHLPKSVGGHVSESSSLEISETSSSSFDNQDISTRSSAGMISSTQESVFPVEQIKEDDESKKDRTYQPVALAVPMEVESVPKTAEIPKSVGSSTCLPQDSEKSDDVVNSSSVEEHHAAVAASNDMEVSQTALESSKTSSEDFQEPVVKDSARCSDASLQHLAALGLTPVASLKGSRLTNPGHHLEDDMPLSVYMNKIRRPGWDSWWWEREKGNIVSWKRLTRSRGQKSKIDYSKLNRGSAADHSGTSSPGGRPERQGVKDRNSDAEKSDTVLKKRSQVSSNKRFNSDGDDDNDTSNRKAKFVPTFLECPLCAMVIHHEKLPRHNEAHFKGNRWHCSHCKISINCDYLSHLGIHLKEAERYDGNFHCDECGLTTDKNYLFELHIRHHALGVRYCAICKSDTGDDFISHFQRHKIKCGTPWVCTLESCGEMLNSRTALQEHLMSHSRVESESYGCPLCAKKFDAMDLYTHHIQSHMEHMTVHICFLCETTCFSEADLMDHIKAHINVDKFCGECGEVFPCGDLDAISRHSCVPSRA